MFWEGKAWVGLTADMKEHKGKLKSQGRGKIKDGIRSQKRWKKWVFKKQVVR